GITLDYNDYYVTGTGGVLGYYNTANVTALPIITGKDANSKNNNPYFTNAGTTAATDYKANSNCLNGSDVTISGQTTDYVGTTRANPPSIGAFEYICGAPAAPVSAITYTIVDNTSIKITGWTDQDCADGYIVKLNNTNSFTTPANGSSPTANTVWANTGEQVVYAGLGKPAEILVTGLSGLSAYHFKVFAYNNCSGSQTYETTGSVQTFYSISGNAGTRNVDMGNGVTSDATGNYSFFVPGGWNGTVTPNRSGVTFSPAAISYTNVASNQTAQDYTATGGPITITGNTGVPGVTITAGAVTAVSDANGDYSITLDDIFNGSFTPSKPGYAFYPNTIRYDIWDISTQNELLNFLAGQAPEFSGNILYVTPNGAGNGSGSSWSNAYDGRSLNIAVINAPVNAQLWIAQGSYSPVKNSVKSSNFWGGYEPGFGVKMYGGFAGNETQLPQRNWTAYPTILNNDNSIPSTIFANGMNYTSTNIDTEVNGFTIQNTETGIELNGSQMTIKNCIFTNNGTGISTERNSIISGCTFNNNKTLAINFIADFSGSQMYENVSNCVFTGNDGTPMGASINIANNYHVTFTNCTFSANYAIDYGGPTSATILNDGECILKNCVMWNNRIDVDGGSTEIGTVRTSILNTGTFTATNCLIQGITTGSDGNLDGITNAADANYPQFVTPVDLSVVKPPTALGDFHILQTSPLVNAGTNTGAPSTDIETTPRDALVDIGTYEYYITISGNAGIASTTLSYTNGTAQTATTGASGNYSIKLPYLWSGTVTPSKTAYIFAPVNYSYTNVATNQTAQDFTATGNFTWTGTTSTDWNTSTNWNSNLVPSATDHGIIPAAGIANFPVVNEAPTVPAVCNNLTINTGAKLTIAAGKALTVNGNLTSSADSTGLVVKSDVNGTGSIKVTGSVSAMASVQRFTNLDRWYLVSSPIGTQTIKDYIAKNEAIPVWSTDLGMYGMRDYATGSSSNWNDYFTNSYLTTNSAQDMGVGKGYLVRTYTYPAEKPVTLKFQGDLNSQANIDVLLARSGNNGWNLIGNPYSSAIKIYDGTTAIEGTPDNFINANDAKFDDVAYGAYFWNDASTPKKFDVINKSTDNIDYPVVTYAQVGQGFFVRAKAEGSSAMSFTKAMQFHKGAEVLKSGAAPFPKIELVATSGDKSVSTDIKFIEGATKGLDRGYDAAILKADPDFALYTKLVEPFDAEFQLQCLPPTSYDKLVIPVGIDSKAGGEIVFSVKTVQLDQDCKAILEDKLTSTFTDLSTGSYKAAIAANTAGTGRFYLHTSDIISGLEDQVLQGKLTAYAKGNKEIRVLGEVGDGAVATLVNGLGQVVLLKKLGSGNLNIIGLPNLKSGLYMLNINDKSTSQTIKIMIRR
ncbi:MAG: choice-of-anchor Q domain-containing protein, partial [Mariniphaga sp.]